MSIAHFYKLDRDQPSERWGVIINGISGLEKDQEVLVKLLQRSSGKVQGHKKVQVMFIKEDGQYGPFALAELVSDCTEQEYEATLAPAKVDNEPF